MNRTRFLAAAAALAVARSLTAAASAKPRRSR